MLKSSPLCADGGTSSSFYLWLSAGALVPSAASSIYVLKWTTKLDGVVPKTAQARPFRPISHLQFTSLSWSTYLLRWLLALQMVIALNRPPDGVARAVTAVPLRGICLYTNFSIQATGWGDPEGDLPLSYTFTADGVLLAPTSVSTRVWVRHRRLLGDPL